MSTAESRKGIRQPQSRKASSGWNRASSARTPVASRLPAGAPAVGPKCLEAPVLRLAVLGDDQHRSAPLAAEREALDQTQDHQQDRGQDADARWAAGRSDTRGDRVRAAPDRTEGIRHDDRAGDRRRRRRSSHIDVLSLLPDQGSLSWCAGRLPRARPLELIAARPAGEPVIETVRHAVAAQAWCGSMPPIVTKSLARSKPTLSRPQTPRGAAAMENHIVTQELILAALHQRDLRDTRPPHSRARRRPNRCVTTAVMAWVESDGKAQPPKRRRALRPSGTR